MTRPDRTDDGTTLRELYRQHEDLIEGAADRLLPNIARRRRRHRIVLNSSIAAVLVAVILGVVSLAGGFPHTVDHGPPPAGYKWEHALGVQVAVPATWQVSGSDPNVGCGSGDAAPTIVLPDADSGSRALCLQLFTGHADIAFIVNADVQPSEVLDVTPFGAPLMSVRIDGVPAVRESGSVGLGGPGVYEGFVIIRSRNVSVIVRTADEATMIKILNSVHLR